MELTHPWFLALAPLLALVVRDQEPAPVARRHLVGVVSLRRLLLVSPEYGHSVPGVLKNALDWLVQSGELSDKRLAIVTASPTPVASRCGTPNRV